MKKLFVIAMLTAAALAASSAFAQTKRTELLAAAPGTNTAAAASTPNVPIIPVPNPVPTLGAPVKCTAHGYFSGNSITLILRRLDAANRTADVEAINTFGITLKKDTFDRNGASWTFVDDVLKYERPNAIRWNLTVKDRQLRGSYWNSGGERYSIPDITFDCPSSTEQIIVR